MMMTMMIIDIFIHHKMIIDFDQQFYESTYYNLLAY